MAQSDVVPPPGWLNTFADRSERPLLIAGFDVEVLGVGQELSVPVGVVADDLRKLTGADQAPSVGQITELTQDFVLKAFATELKGHGFAQFCGWLLEALGYSTQVAPPGADGGVDILATEDPLGVKPPALKVQCKSSSSPTGSADVQALNGTLSQDDLGVFMSVGGFSAPARNTAAGMPRMRLIGPAELVELILDHYRKLPDEAKIALPLRQVWMPDRPAAEG